MSSVRKLGQEAHLSFHEEVGAFHEEVGARSTSEFFRSRRETDPRLESGSNFSVCFDPISMSFFFLLGVRVAPGSEPVAVRKRQNIDACPFARFPLYLRCGHLVGSVF